METHFHLEQYNGTLDSTHAGQLLGPNDLATVTTIAAWINNGTPDQHYLHGALDDLCI
jgi:hypothetical protein